MAGPSANLERVGCEVYNAHAGRVLYARSNLSSFVSASILSFLIFGGFFYVLSIWLDRPANPATSFAAAFDGLSAVDSVHFVMEEDRAGGIGSYRFTNLGVLDVEIAEHRMPADWDEFEEQTEEDCIVRDGDYRYCIIRKRGTGEEVGQVEWGYGMRTTSEGALVRPNSVHYTESWQPDRDLRISGQRDGVEMNLLYLDGVTWSRTTSGDSYWRVVSEDGPRTSPEWDLFSWGLLDAAGRERPGILDRYINVERLEDAELDGVLVEHYQAGTGEGSEVLEIWVGKYDGLILKIHMKWNLGAGSDAISSDRTYTFSRFDEPVDIPRPWPCFGAPHC